MKKTLVIGYGNTLRGDDGAGIRAAEAIAAGFPEMECLCSHELQMEMSETISHFQDVFFLDASATARSLICRPLEPARANEPLGSHAVSPEYLLFFCKQLYQRTPLRSTLIEIPAFQFDFCEKLSAATARMVNECFEAVGRLSGSRGHAAAPAPGTGAVRE